MTVYIIHSKDSRFEELISINDKLSISTDINLIKSILDDNGPKEFLVSFGYTGWSKGQLEKEILKGIFLKDKRDESDFNHTLSLIKQYEIIKECYQKANHYINLASNSLSIFKDCNEKNILENLTSFSLSRDF